LGLILNGREEAEWAMEPLLAPRTGVTARQAQSVDKKWLNMLKIVVRPMEVFMKMSSISNNPKARSRQVTLAPTDPKTYS